jgi:hypothetical protein
MHWLINELIRDRLPQSERSALLMDALKRASLGWAIALTSRIHSEHWPRSHEQPTSPERCLVDATTASALTAATLEKLRDAAQSGELLGLRHLLSALFRWGEFSGACEEVRNWTDAHLGEDKFVIRLADAVTSTTWVTSVGFDGMGDRVSRGVPNVQIDGLERILAVNRFLARVTEIEGLPIEDGSKQVLTRFREGMRIREEEHARRQPAGEPNSTQGEDADGNEAKES